jgi:hypothetical protein
MQCNFTECSATVAGGALSVNTDGQLLIDAYYFSGSSSGDNGGALSLATVDDVINKPVQFNIIRSIFDDNKAPVNGNAIYISSGVLNLTHSIVRNHVYKQHEAVYTAAAITYV